MPSLEVPIFTFTLNCGKHAKQLIHHRSHHHEDQSDIISSSSSSSSPVYKNFTENVRKALPDNACTIYAFGFQELCSIIDGSFPLIVRGYLNKIANNVLITLLNDKYNGGEGGGAANYNFEVVGIAHMGAIGLILISPYLTKFSNVRAASSACGHFYSSLKGACGLRFTLADGSSTSTAEFTFTCCHLNANEGIRHWRKRNQDLISLMRSLDFNDGWGVLSPKAHCFIMGDLNYRASANKELLPASQLFNEGNNNTDSEEVEPLNRATTNNGNGSSSRSKISDPSDLASVDELTISRLDKKEAFWGFNEAKITFAPTYKFHDHTNNYNFKRAPSWCDRVLYQAYSPSPPTFSLPSSSSLASLPLGSSSSFSLPNINGNNSKKDTNNDFAPAVERVIKYDSIPQVTLSDHKPVFLHMSVPFQPPENIIDDNGYLLIDQVGIKSKDSVYLKPTVYDKFIGNVTLAIDGIIGWGLFGITTTRGRASVVGVSVLFWLVWLLFPR